MESFGLFPCDSSLVFFSGGDTSVSRSRSHSPVYRSPVCRSRPRSRSRSPVCRSRPRSRSRSPVCRSRPRSRSRSPVCRSRPRSRSRSRSRYSRHRSPDSSSQSPEPHTRLGELINRFGTKVDIVSLLCSRRRDFLVDKDGNKVSVSSVTNTGKYIIIICFEVPVKSYSKYGEICWALKSALSTPLWSSNCQLVVGLNLRSEWKHKHKYNNYLLYSFLSALPNSLAIPFWDSASYRRLSEYLRPLNFCAPALVLDPDHVVLNQDCDNFVSFGAQSFPFTDDHLSTLLTTVNNKWSIQRPVPLEDLLGLRLVDSLSNLSATATISVSDLKHKLVGLYLFRNGTLSNKINTVYKQCQANHRDLEIVVVYLSFNDNPAHFMASANAFLKKQGISSWWVLPFDYSTSRMLWNLCRETIKEELVIVGPQGQFLERKAALVINDFDPMYDMYPYAAEPIAKQETARLQNLTLESLLLSTTPHHDYLLTQQAHHIHVTELRGKRVLLFIANLHHQEDFRKIMENMAYWTYWCSANKEYCRTNEIKLVFVPLFYSNDLSLSSKDLMPWLWGSTMPWLICPSDDPVRLARIVKDTTIHGFNINDMSCLTFREDGRILSQAWPDQLSDHNWANDDQLYYEILCRYTDKLDYDSSY